MTLTLALPPKTPAEPVIEMLHGVSITDPYRWLEDQDSPRTRKWLEEQVAYARRYLNAIPGRERIRKRIEEFLAVETISFPWKAANRYFFLKRPARDERLLIMMREGDDGKDSVLVDPRSLSRESTFAVGIAGISCDGKILAFSTLRGGEETCAINFLDVDRAITLPDQLPRGLNRGLAVSPCGQNGQKGFYYVHGTLDASRENLRAVKWHAFGTQAHEDVAVFALDEDSPGHLVMFASPNASRLGYVVYSYEEVPRVDFYIHDVASGSRPEKIVEALEGDFSPQFVGNRVIALTEWEAPNRRIVSIDPEHPERSAWRDIIPETQARIESFAVAGGLVFAAIMEGVDVRIAMYDLSGKPCGTVPCPNGGSVRISSCDPDGDKFFYSFTSFSDPPTIYRYDPLTGEQSVWTRKQVPFEGSRITVEQAKFASKDGTIIPMFLVSEKGRRRSGPLPTFLTGYGGFANSITPQFTAYASFLMEQGFLFAVANLRGGAEFGKDWHEAAKRHKRQNAIDDFIAAAEWLIAHGEAAPGKIAIGGGSNAGLLVGAALTQRPDLFRAVISLGPLLDMLRYHKFDQASLWEDEFGSAEIADDFPYLRAYSPYHNVRPDVRYPAVLFISGDADTRCNPMHARKMTAALQAATSSGHPVLLDYKSTWGHVPVQSLTTRIESLSDRLAFICHELGVNTQERESILCGH